MEVSEDEKERRGEDKKMKYKPPHYWKKPALKRPPEKSTQTRQILSRNFNFLLLLVNSFDTCAKPKTWDPHLKLEPFHFISVRPRFVIRLPKFNIIFSSNGVGKQQKESARAQLRASLNSIIPLGLAQYFFLVLDFGKS